MSPLTTNSITLRTVLLYALGLLCTAAFVAYVLFQARFILAGPQVTITTVNSAQNERLITIEGTAKNIVHITLNGRQIYTDTHGNFKEALVLENGYTIVTLQAQDRYGRVEKETREFVYTTEEMARIN